MRTEKDGFVPYFHRCLESFDRSDGWEQRQPLIGPTFPAGVVSLLTWLQDGQRLAITFASAEDPSDV